jgi:predicted glutamine amidotransferase
MSNLLFYTNIGINSKIIYSFLNSKYNEKNGFGLGWFEDDNLIVYKRPLKYTEDLNLENTIKKMDKNIVFGNTSKYNDIGIYNIQPFIHENQIFLHDGFIKDYNNHKRGLINIVHITYKKLIKGNSESELLFYIYLTFLKTKPNNYKWAMEQMINIFKKLNIELNGNFIYANKDFALVVRKSNSSLYINDVDGIIVSSEPIKDTDVHNYRIISEDSIILIDIKKSKIV